MTDPNPSSRLKWGKAALTRHALEAALIARWRARKQAGPRPAPRTGPRRLRRGRGVSLDLGFAAVLIALAIAIFAVRAF